MQKISFFLFGVIPAMLLQSLGALFYVTIFDTSAAAQWIYILVKIVIVVFITFWLIKKPPLPKLTLRWDTRHALLGIFSGLMCAVGIGILACITQEALFAAAPSIRLRLGLFPAFLGYFVPFALAFSILHALFEEWYWRHFVGFGLAIYLSPLAAAILGSLAFTSHHILVLWPFFSPWIVGLYSLGIGIAGMLWIYLYRVTHNILTPWLSHLIADLAIFVILGLLL